MSSRLITRYSNNARTAATQRCTVDAAAATRPAPIRGSRAPGAAHPLPIDRVEHHRSIDRSQRHIPFAEEPRQVHHVECVRAHRGRAEPRARSDHPGCLISTASRSGAVMPVRC